MDFSHAHSEFVLDQIEDGFKFPMPAQNSLGGITFQPAMEGVEEQCLFSRMNRKGREPGPFRMEIESDPCGEFSGVFAGRGFKMEARFQRWRGSKVDTFERKHSSGSVEHIRVREIKVQFSTLG